MLTRQRELYAAAKANPATAGLPVLAPALAFRQNYAGARRPVARTPTSPTRHMYPGGYRPSNEVTQITAALRGSSPTSRWS